MISSYFVFKYKKKSNISSIEVSFSHLLEKIFIVKSSKNFHSDYLILPVRLLEGSSKVATSMFCKQKMWPPFSPY
jgi:hypothetical protein